MQDEGLLLHRNLTGAAQQRDFSWSQFRAGEAPLWRTQDRLTSLTMLDLLKVLCLDNRSCFHPKDPHITWRGAGTVILVCSAVKEFRLSTVHGRLWDNKHRL